MAELSMTIDGTAVPTADTFEVINPATGEAHAEAPECSKEQLDAAFESAQKAYRDWRTDEKLRRELLLPDRRRGAVRPGSSDHLLPGPR